MESSNKETFRPPFRSLRDYRREAKRIMIHLGFTYLIHDEEILSDCMEAIMRAEIDFKSHMGKLSTLKFKCVKNECCKILQKMKSIKFKKNKKIVLLKSYNAFTYDNIENILDCETIIQKMWQNDKLIESSKKCFYNYFVLGMTQKAIAKELGITKQAVQQRLITVAKTIREDLDG